MKEKDYHIFEEDDAAMAAEPMQNVTVAGSHQGFMPKRDELDDINWDNYPVFGPKTTEEAIARIDQAWEESNNPSKWMTSEQLDKVLGEKYPWLR